jgi:hypothetical protein
MDIFICGAISILGIFAAIRNGNPSPLLLILIMCVANVLFRIGDYRYRVYWVDGAVVCNTADNGTITIRAADIARIEFERSGANTLFRMERPSLRIAIYDRNEQHLDVSLRHFAIADIHRLMDLIHEGRPDLVIPKF